jgi:hypothetical protein
MYKCIVCIYSMSDHNTIEIVFLLCIFRKLLFGKGNTRERNRALEAKTHEANIRDVGKTVHVVFKYQKPEAGVLKKLSLAGLAKLS